MWVNMVDYEYDPINQTIIKKSEISINWFLSQILGKKKSQITKVNDNEIQQFVFALEQIEMPDGDSALSWARKQLQEKCEMASAKQGEVWYKIHERYKYIIFQMDMIISNPKFIQKTRERMNVVKKEEVDKKKVVKEKYIPKMKVSFKKL